MNVKTSVSLHNCQCAIYSAVHGSPETRPVGWRNQYLNNITCKVHTRVSWEQMLRKFTRSLNSSTVKLELLSGFFLIIRCEPVGAGRSYIIGYQPAELKSESRWWGFGAWVLNHNRVPFWKPRQPMSAVAVSVLVQYGTSVFFAQAHGHPVS